MKNNSKGVVFLVLFISLGCASAADNQQKSFVDQAVWSQTTKDKVYGACLTALTMAHIAVYPLGISKESGLIVTRPRERHIGYGDKKTVWHYTLQIAVFENQDKKVMVTLSAVDAGYNGRPPEPELTDMRRYFNENIADDAGNFFNQLDNLLGKAEYYRPGKVLFPLQK